MSLMPTEDTNPVASANRPAYDRRYFSLAVIFALLAVVLGAFGAHALHDHLVARGSVATWETAVDYQFWHAIALLLWVLFNAGNKGRRIIPLTFAIGILLFSGSLYILALGGPRWMGPITPLGGLSFMLGWAIWLFSGPSPLQNTHEK